VTTLLTTPGPVIDVHTHAIPDAWAEHLEASGVSFGHDGDQIVVRRHGRVVRVVPRVGWDGAARLAAMDELGVDVHVVSPPPFLYLYDVDPGLGAECCRAVNEAALRMTAASPERLLGLGAVPLQEPSRAVDEVAWLAAAGFRGIAIGAEINGELPGSDRFVPVLEAAAALRMVVFVHPREESVDPALEPVGLGFGLGFPSATGTAAAHLAWSGILDRLPGLQVLLAHGGGTLPALVGRLTTGWERLPGRAGRLEMHPRQALGRFWADSLTYDPDVLRLAATVFGEGHVLLGSDFPFAAREEPLGDALRHAVAAGLLSSDALAAIAGENATRLFATD